MFLTAKTLVFTIARLIVFFGILINVIALKTIVVGSGPGGIGFIKHALEIDSVDTFYGLRRGKKKIFRLA